MDYQHKKLTEITPEETETFYHIFGVYPVDVWEFDGDEDWGLNPTYLDRQAVHSNRSKPLSDEIRERFGQQAVDLIKGWILH